MKHVVELQYTNPSHEHVSLRRRVETVNRVVEAQSEEEALNRAANQQRALGFRIQSANIIEQKVEESTTEVLSEETELDEGKVAKALAVGAMSLASMGAKAHTDTTKSVAQLAHERPALAQRLHDIGATGQVPASDKRAAELQRKQDQEMPASERRAKELKKEEVEQVDEVDYKKYLKVSQEKRPLKLRAVDDAIAADKAGDPNPLRKLRNTNNARKFAQKQLTKKFNASRPAQPFHVYEPGRRYVGDSVEHDGPTIDEARRMSAAVKLQRAFDREKTASDASRKRGEEVLAQARAEYAKKQAAKTNEDVEQVDEANMRFDPEAAARPKSSDVKNFLNRNKNARAGAASKKYIRRMTKLGGLGPNQTKKDTEAHMKAHFEEVEQVDEARGYKIEPKESPVFKGSRANPMMRHFSVSVGNKEVGWLEHDKDDDTVRGSLHGKSVNISRHKGDTVADKFKSYINQMKEEAEQVDEGSKRMSAAVKLQRAFDREKTASDASRKRGEEMLTQARKEYDKKQVAKTNEEVEQFEGFLSFLRKKPVAKKKPAVSHKHMRAVFSTIERQTRVAKPQQTGPVIHRHTVAAYESVEQIDERNKANAEAKKKVLRQAGVNAAISGKVRFGGSALQMGREAAKKLPSKGLAKAYRELPRVAEQMTDNAAITKKTERERRIRDTRVIHHQNRHIHQAAMGTMEESAGKSLADKARKSGISLGTLRKVYNRGVAAWNSGHRPGTTPQQWGHARVNSYITKGKTYHTADKDLRRESVDVNEAFEREFGDK